MTEGERAAGGARFKAVPTPESHFSWLRTRMSIERTLMSALRTATALIAFGFTLFQFLRQFNATAGVSPARHPEAARYLGLTLIAAGIIGLAIGVWEYRRMIRYLWGSEFRSVAGIDEMPWRTPTLLLAVVLVAIGIFAFAAVWLRI